MKENFKEILRLFRREVNKYELLNSIFTDKYFMNIETQLVSLENDPSTYLNPIFLAYLRDESEGSRLLKSLNNNLINIYERTSSIKIKRHIAGQLRGLNAFDTLVELSVLNGLVQQLSKNDIELFPQTIGDHDVEARIKIDDRWIYIEVSTLDDQLEDREEISALLRNSQVFGKFKSVDIKKDSYRIVGKSAGKSKQFSPDTPNILFLVLIGTKVSLHDLFGEERELTVNGVSCLFEFDRNLKYSKNRMGLSPQVLTEKEKTKLVELVTSDKWVPLLRLS